MMLGFAKQRRAMLEAELRRIAEELPRLGARAAFLVGDLADGTVGPESALEVIVVHETAEPPHRRPDFFTSHLRPEVATHFIVYTPVEFEAAVQRADDPLLRRAMAGAGALASDASG